MVNNIINNNINSYSSDYIAMTGSGTVKRIRTPALTDVLLGRGGGINNHAGNKIFREWIAERKEDYNLAGSKAEKTRVAMEVMERVRKQTPPGRFLQRDGTSSRSSAGGGTGRGAWWVEVDELRALAKTSQALREGAPQIRAAHQGQIPTTSQRPIRTSSKINTPVIPTVDGTTANKITTTSSTRSKQRKLKSSRSSPASTTTKLKRGPIRATRQGAKPTSRTQTSPFSRLKSVPPTTNVFTTAATTPKPTSHPPTVKGPPNRVSSGTKRALNELSRNWVQAKSRYDPFVLPVPPTYSEPPLPESQSSQPRPLQPMGMIESMSPPAKRIRISDIEPEVWAPDVPPIPPRDIPAHRSMGDVASLARSAQATATATSVPSSPLIPVPIPFAKNMDFSRTHSLALSDLEEWDNDDPGNPQDDFVNPFLNEFDSCSSDNNLNGDQDESPAAAPAVEAAAAAAPETTTATTPDDNNNNNSNKDNKDPALSRHHHKQENQQLQQEPLDTQGTTTEIQNLNEKDDDVAAAAAAVATTTKNNNNGDGTSDSNGDSWKIGNDSNNNNNNNIENNFCNNINGGGMIRNVSSDAGNDEYLHLEEMDSFPISCRDNEGERRVAMDDDEHNDDVSNYLGRLHGGRRYSYPAAVPTMPSSSTSSSYFDFHDELRFMMDAIYANDDANDEFGHENEKDFDLSPLLASKGEARDTVSSIPTLLLPRGRGGSAVHRGRYGSVGGVLKRTTSSHGGGGGIVLAGSTAPRSIVSTQQ